MKEFTPEVVERRDPFYTGSRSDTGYSDPRIGTFNVRAISGNKITVGKIQSTDGNTFFDLDNKFLIVNDGANDRILLGYQLNGF